MLFEKESRLRPYLRTLVRQVQMFVFVLEGLLPQFRLKSYKSCANFV